MKSKAKKERLDNLLVIRGLAESRAKAQSLILAGQVFAREQRLDKVGKLVPDDIELTIKEPLPFVSRGGLKLAAALDHFQLDVTGMTCLDIGASTRGSKSARMSMLATSVLMISISVSISWWSMSRSSR